MVIYGHVRALREKEDVDDLQYSAGVHEKEDDEPYLFMASCCQPERPSFPEQCPNDKEENEGGELVNAEAGAPVESARPKR